MKVIYNSKTEFNDILRRVQKDSFYIEGFFIGIKRSFTNNTFYYFIALIIRFIPLFLLSGDYLNMIKENKESFSFHYFIEQFTLYNCAKHFNLSFNSYFIINLFIYILLIIRIICYGYIITSLKNFEEKKNWSFIDNFRNIYDHIIFLLFPYIIEFLSFVYYIIIFPNEFIIKINDKKNTDYLYIISSINTILIVFYNINNYIYFIYINKTYTTRSYEAYIKVTNEEKINNKCISYRFPNLTIIIIIFSQNFSIIGSLDKCFNAKNKILFKIIISIILCVLILMLIISRFNVYNYMNFINISTNILFLYCFYSIVFDLILLISKYEFNKIIFEMIYVIIKFFAAYITYSLFLLRIKRYFESKINEILFHSKKNENENIFLNSFYYLHEIMLKVKENKDINSVYIINNFLNEHFTKCNKSGCNCRLLSPIIRKENSESNNKELMKNYIKDLLNILNYLFECVFIEFDYYNNYELAILLAEHFCHLKNNPTMAFSLINTLTIKQKNKLSKYQTIILCELLQGYIYYISANSKRDSEKRHNEMKYCKQNEEIFKIYYYNSIATVNIKKNITNYIDNHIKILKYKNIFEESIKFNFDESNEIITCVKIKFFDNVSNINDSYLPNIKIKNTNKNLKSKTNLYKVIYLLKKEQLFYNKIIKCINSLKVFKNIPIYIIFKYYLFFDVLNGGKIPQEIVNKFYQNFSEKLNLYSNHITYNEYLLLKKLYSEQSENINSKYFSMFEYKNDLRTIYFSESCALNLGYKQKDIINEKLDQLMPKKFYESHQNMVKLLIVGNQLKYTNTSETYLFDISSNILYPIIQESLLIYSISKNLIIIVQSIFKFDNEYRFMLNNNFELLAVSKNYEDEYYFNKKIFEAYDIKIMEILQVKPMRIYKIFEKVFKKIDEQRLIRKTKTEEYFIPYFYAQAGDRNLGMMNPSNFNNAKKNFLAKISNSKKEYENINDNNDDEKNIFISTDKNKKILDEFFNNSGQIVFHDNFNFILTKLKFIENISKEIAKIPDNDLMFENDKFNYNLIVAGKKLINKLLRKKENFSNNMVRIKIKLSYYYDKPFYFIFIDDEKKAYVKISKGLNFRNNNSNKNIDIQKNIIDKKLNNCKNISNKNYKYINKEKNASINKYRSDMDKDIDKSEKEKNEILNKIEGYCKEINRDKFILIIKIILSAIIFFIFLIYILIIIVQNILIKRAQSVLITHYYNTQTQNSLLDVYSLLLEIYYNAINLSKNKISNYSQQQQLLYQYTYIFKDYYFNFTENYINFNIEAGNNFNILFDERKFYKIEGFWEETEIRSEVDSEMKLILYELFSINTTILYSEDLLDELKNFYFFKNKTSSYKKVESTFIKLLHFICTNYEFNLKIIFQEFSNLLFQLFKDFNFYNVNSYLILEILGLLFYIVFFFAVIVYLYYSNQIILKNIIFLFLDFSDEQYYKNRLNSNNKIILKLLELQNLIDNFNLDTLKKYSDNLDRLNKSQNKDILLESKSLSCVINSERENRKILGERNNLSQNKIYNVNNYIKNKAGRNSIQKTSSKNIMLISKKERDLDKSNSKKLLVKMKSISNSAFKLNNLMNFHSQKLDDSAQNFLLKNNSKAHKDKINEVNPIDKLNEIKEVNNNTVISNEINPKELTNKKGNITIDDYIFGNKKNNTFKNEENNINENYQDILLNKSNKTLIFLIKIFVIIILFLIVIIIVFSIYKLKLALDFKILFNYYFIDFTSITNRYALLIYTFNIFRTLIIFPEDERKMKFIDIMENFNQKYDLENKIYTNILASRINDYKETKKLLEILQDKHNTTEKLKDIICLKNYTCELYLNSTDNIFASGVDFAYKTCIKQINNIYLDYKKLDNNKTNIDIINSTIINGIHSQFENIVESINNMFCYVQIVIFETFKVDQINFKNQYSRNMTLLNIISVIFSFLTLLFVNIIVFFGISNFTKPIKNSSYRINCSFYFIKQHSLTNRK